MVRQRTMLINALRGHCAEFGIIAAQGLSRAGELIKLIEDAAGQPVAGSRNARGAAVFDLPNPIDPGTDRLDREEATGLAHLLRSKPATG